jgi:hypothetical protein
MPSGLETALFARLIDHAPLFPPAQLPLPEALEEHRLAREGPHGWIVRRFVAPASVLAALDGEPLALSVVMDDDEADVDDPRVESVEIPPKTGGSGVLRIYPVESYAEVDVRMIPGLEAGPLKIRCGPTPPPMDELAAAIRACRERSIVFKATAGLHHAIRRDGEHGFLNLLAAAVFGDEAEALAEDDPTAFGLDAGRFVWRDRAAYADETARVRRNLFAGFGSCSVAEPVAELRALAILTA